MRTRILDKAAEAIRRKYPLSARLATLARLATWDLWHGPTLPSELDDDDAKIWPGFSDACEELRAWADEHLPGMYYDNDSGNLISELPEGYEDEITGEWVEPFLEETYQLSSKDILAAIFPRKLWEYI